jgi:hypothetical protein
VTEAEYTDHGFNKHPDIGFNVGTTGTDMTSRYCLGKIVNFLPSGGRT